MCALSPPLRYILWVSSSLVSEDIAETIREKDQSAEIVFAKSHAAVAEHLAGGGPLAVFIGISLQRLDESGLCAAIAAQGGWLVIVGASVPPDRAASEGWLLLTEPFTSEMVEEVLAALRLRCLAARRG